MQGEGAKNRFFGELGNYKNYIYMIDVVIFVMSLGHFV